MTTEALLAPPSPPPAKRLNRAMSLAMVVGTMIGSGIYLLPATLAPFGPNIIWAFALTITGTMLLALTFAWLARQLPGGPFVYVRSAFGDTAAFLTLWSYMVSQWTGVAAVAVAVGGAIGFVLPGVAGGTGLTIVALGTIALLTLVNLRGARAAGWVQVAATLIKVLPLLAVVILLAVRFGGTGQVEPLAAMPVGLAGIAGAAALMLFSLTGFEAATVTANLTDDAQTSVPRATILGTGLTGLIYFGATLAALLLLPSAIAASSGAPFASAIAPILGNGAGAIVAVIAAISAFGTCNALLLLAAGVGQSLSLPGDLPAWFGRTNAAGAPVGSLLTGAGVAALLVLASRSENFVEVYAFIALVSTVAALVLYAVCAAAALKLRTAPRWWWVPALALVYALAMFVGAGVEATAWGLALALAGLPLRWLSRRTSPAAARADGPGVSAA